MYQGFKQVKFFFTLITNYLRSHKFFTFQTIMLIKFETISSGEKPWPVEFN